MTKYDALKLTEECEPVFWEVIKAYVVRDGYALNGTRIHFVTAKGFCGGMVSGAYVFSV